MCSTHIEILCWCLNSSHTFVSSSFVQLFSFSQLECAAILCWDHSWYNSPFKSRPIELSFGVCGRGRGRDDLGEWHWNMYNIIYEMSRQSRFDARYWMLGAGALGRPRGMAWGGRREEVSGWGTHVYLWQIHFDIWQNQYNIVKLKNKRNFKKKRKKNTNTVY